MSMYVIIRLNVGRGPARKVPFRGTSRHVRELLQRQSEPSSMLLFDDSRLATYSIIHIDSVIDNIYERRTAGIRVIRVSFHFPNQGQISIGRPRHQIEILRSIRLEPCRTQPCRPQTQLRLRATKSSVINIGPNPPIVARHRSILNHIFDLFRKAQRSNCVSSFENSRLPTS